MKSIPSDILREAADCIESRATERDCGQERTMGRCVAAFNGLTNHGISEHEGWLFMAILKMARAVNGEKFIRDDYVDGAAYMALAGECAGLEKGGGFVDDEVTVMEGGIHITDPAKVVKQWDGEGEWRWLKDGEWVFSGDERAGGCAGWIPTEFTGEKHDRCKHGTHRRRRSEFGSVDDGAGDGWRILKGGESTEDGDEFLSDGCWKPITGGWPLVEKPYYTYRRRVTKTPKRTEEIND